MNIHWSVFVSVKDFFFIKIILIEGQVIIIRHVLKSFCMTSMPAVRELSCLMLGAGVQEFLRQIESLLAILTIFNYI